MFAVTKKGVPGLTRNMHERGAKPKRGVEEACHHTPATWIVDDTMLREIRHLCCRGEELAAAHRTAIRISLALDAIARGEAQKDRA